MNHMMVSFCLFSLISALLIPTTSAFLIDSTTTRPHFTSSSALSAHSLTTCLESLGKERRRTEDVYQCLSWLDLADDATATADIDDSDSVMTTLPLYPLGAVYLPTKDTTNHTLNNVEPQNVQMAQDLLRKSQNDDIDKDKDNAHRFCAVLRAMDTGRIASIGTVMRIVEAEEQFHYGTEDIARIRLTCQAEGLVQICHVENGAGWSEKRLTKSSEYLVASVRPTMDDDTRQQDDAATLREKLLALVKELRTIKTMYQLDLGAEDYPPGWLPKIGDAIQDDCIEIAKYDAGMSDLDNEFWRLAQEWQSVCYTLRQGQQSLLSAERNERMVEAACNKGGPLKLPIHMEDLEPEERREIQRMEMEAQERHIELGIDPVLDFQVLISLPTLGERIEWLNKIMSREQRRLAEAASLQYSKRVS